MNTASVLWCQHTSIPDEYGWRTALDALEWRLFTRRTEARTHPRTRLFGLPIQQRSARTAFRVVRRRNAPPPIRHQRYKWLSQLQRDDRSSWRWSFASTPSNNRANSKLVPPSERVPVSDRRNSPKDLNVGSCCRADRRTRRRIGCAVPVRAFISEQPDQGEESDFGQESDTHDSDGEKHVASRQICHSVPHISRSPRG
jgi:hypothetical protein